MENSIASLEELEDRLSAPSPGVVEAMRRIPGDVIVLGVGGKMGPSLARMIRRATDLAGVSRRVIGVSRFSSRQLPEQLAGWGIETISADLLEEEQLASLPECANVIYMAGMKFGATGNEGLTWAMNAHLPGLVCRKFKRSRIVAFSTGNVYGLVPVESGGSVEIDGLSPVGEYAQSCMGRERMFEYYALKLSIPVAIVRLNYAVEMRYGVIVDVAMKVMRGEAVDVSMGYANVIWQGDANAHSICALAKAGVPAVPVNVAGPELVSIRRLAEEIGELLGKRPVFTGSEAGTALLSNAGKSHGWFGRPGVGLERVIEWTADWLKRGMPTHLKPTHFESREGKF